MSDTALDRLKSMMTDSDKDESISSDEYIDNIEDDIISKMNSPFEEVSLESEPTIVSIDEPTTPIMTQPPIIENKPNIEEKPKRHYNKTKKSVVEKSTIETQKINNNLFDIPIDVTDTGDDSPFDQNDINEELFNNNNTENTNYNQQTKQRGRKKKHGDTGSVSSTAVNIDVNSANDSRNPLYDQLVINMINELRTRRFTFSGFSVESMEILFNYISNKF